MQQKLKSQFYSKDRELVQKKSAQRFKKQYFSEQQNKIFQFSLTDEKKTILLQILKVLHTVEGKIQIKH